MPDPLQLTFSKLKDTKNAVRYAEDVDEGEHAIAGTLYLQKSEVASKELGDRIMVTITRAE